MSSSAWSLNYEVRCYFSFSAVEPCAIVITKKLDAYNLFFNTKNIRTDYGFFSRSKKRVVFPKSQFTKMLLISSTSLHCL